jgi:hypothetical protein
MARGTARSKVMTHSYPECTLAHQEGARFLAKLRSAKRRRRRCRVPGNLMARFGGA